MLHSLKVFIKVAECRNLTKAAEQLFLTQPTVSWHIHKKLEETELNGIKLFKHDFELTEHGKIFYESAQKIIRLYNHTCEEIKTYDLLSRKSFRGVLRIGASPNVSNYFLPYILSIFNNIHPNISFLMVSHHPKEVAQKVLSKSLDVGIIGCNYEILGLDFNCILESPYFIVFNIDKLNIKKIEEIKREPFIKVEEEDSNEGCSVEKLLEKTGYSTKDFNIKCSLSDIEGAKVLIRKGFGFSIMDRLLITNEKKIKKVKFNNHNKRYYLVLPANEISDISRIFRSFLFEILSKKSIELPKLSKLSI